MILVDTSVWIDHFRGHDPALAELIAEGEIALHPFVLGELLLGGIPAASGAVEDLQLLPLPPVASADEASAFIVQAELAGKGIGYVDVHLLMSAKLQEQGRILTRDQSLHGQAERLGIAFAL